MKKATFLILFIFTLVSCEEDVSFNNPAFQARKDNSTWRAQEFTSVYNETNSTLTITAFKEFEKITFTINPVIASMNESNLLISDGTFNLNKTSTTTAEYSYVVSGETFLYSTSVENNFNGLIELKNSANQKPGTISGTFRFNALIEGTTEAPTDQISFQNGIFYEIPLTVEITQESK